MFGSTLTTSIIRMSEWTMLSKSGRSSTGRMLKRDFCQLQAKSDKKAAQIDELNYTLILIYLQDISFVCCAQPNFSIYAFLIEGLKNIQA